MSKYKYPAWKRQWMKMSGGIFLIFGSLTLITIVTDYLNKFGCENWYGLAATITAILYSGSFIFYYLADKEKK